MRSVRIVVALCVAVVACGTERSGRTEAGGIDVGAGLTAERTWVGPRVRVDDVATIDDRVVVALASSGRISSGDVVLRSADGGRTWEERPSGFEPLGTDRLPSALVLAEPGAHLMLAGRTLVASRTIGPPSGWGEVTGEVVVSDDLGSTWVEPSLPVPQGTTPIVNGAAELDGALALVGAVQSERPTPPSITMDDDEFAAAMDHADAAAWLRSAGEAEFEPVSIPGAAGAPGMQFVSDAVAVAGRLVVVGGDSRDVDQQCCFPQTAPVVWSTVDSTMWGEPDVLPTGAGPVASTRELDVLGRDVSLGTSAGRMVLAVGSAEWTAEPLPSGPGPEGHTWTMPASATLTTLPDGAMVGTWNDEDNPCDCDTGFAGRIEGDQLSATRLPFEDCTLTPVGSGQSRVGRAWALRDAMVAGFWCGDLGRAAAGVAVSPDAGRTWSTARLSGLAPRGAEDLAFTSWTPWTKVGDAMVVLATATSDEPSDDWRDVSGPVVAIRVS